MTNLPLTILSQTALKVTVGWSPPAAAAGYEFLRDGTRVSSTFDGSKSQATFGIPDSSPHTFEVRALSTAAAGTVTVNTPTPPATDLFARFTQLQQSKVAAQLGAAAKRILQPTTAADALTAINNLQAGDSVRLPAGLTVPGRVILPRLAAPADVLCNGAKFTGVDNSQALSQGRWDTIFAGHAANIRMYDGEVTRSANAGIRLYGDVQNLGFYRFKVHDVNGSGLLWQPIYGDVTNCSFTGEIWACGVQWWVDQFDPHSEKGTGTHCVYLGGASGGWIRGGGIYAHVHDQPYGAGVEVNLVTDNMEIGCYGERLTFKAQRQVAGNVVQPWGDNGRILFPFLYGADSTGRVMDTNTSSPDNAYSTMTVAFGRAHNMCLAPSPGEGNVAVSEPFDPRRGVVYQDKAVI